MDIARAAGRGGMLGIANGLTYQCSFLYLRPNDSIALNNFDGSELLIM
jgi:hypothetical protein